MAAGKRTSKNAQGKFAAYQANQTWLKNKRKKQANHLKAHPNDLASKTLNTSYGRRDPKSREWTSPTKELAQLVKGIYGICPKDIFHANPLIANAELTKLNSRTKKLPRQGGNLFSLKERVKWGTL